MNYSKLLEGKTKDQIYEIADNWRKRTQRLVAKYKTEIIEQPKPCRIYFEMERRLYQITKIIKENFE